MKVRDLRSERLKRGWGQVAAARRLGVSQPYLNMLERRKRPLTPDLARKVALVYGLSPAKLPVPATFTPAKKVGSQRLVEYLSRLDYPGFAYVRSHVKKKNPAEVLLTALAQGSLEARVAEALPWLALHYWDMDVSWLVERAEKIRSPEPLGIRGQPGTPTL
jgi:transcriptional regulator with XRE-family HTH domain